MATDTKITFVTGNQNKADYLARLLGVPIDHVKLNLDEIQSTSLREIVEHKARQAYDIVRKPVIVDDVALGFSVLNGLPGPFIKFFTENGTELLCRMLDGFSDRSATGYAGIGYYDGLNFHYFEGNINGTIADAPRGTGGYSWDDVFVPNGYGERTRAELSSEEYDELYRKFRPVAELKDFLFAR